MSSTLARSFHALPIEEKILNGASFAAFISLFFPWVGGEWLGGKIVTYSGLGFFTSFIGVGVLLLHLLILLSTIVPIAGGPHIISGSLKRTGRLLCAGLSVFLLFAAWSVLIKFTFEFSRLEIHFGLYACILASLVSTLYAFLTFQEKRSLSDSSARQEHPQQHIPPPPSEPEQHRMF